MPEKEPEAKEVDYMHPEGSPQRAPRTEQEARNEKKAEESTELAEELTVDGSDLKK